MLFLYVRLLRNDTFEHLVWKIVGEDEKRNLERERKPARALRPRKSEGALRGKQEEEGGISSEANESS